ncbi:hypothetical protein, partial [Agrococcus casei]|uniref:hypothetical protein n=1 Tax=Agrococcus casei TaxID=343512 RepID=UPI003F8FB9F1
VSAPAACVNFMVTPVIDQNSCRNSDRNSQHWPRATHGRTLADVNYRELHSQRQEVVSEALADGE